MINHRKRIIWNGGRGFAMYYQFQPFVMEGKVFMIVLTLNFGVVYE